MPNLPRRAWEHRWFILAVGFLVLNVCAVVRFLAGPSLPGRWGGARGREDREQVLKVEQTEPNAQDNLAAQANIQFTFSQDVVGPQDVGTKAPKGPIRFEPAVSGECQWVSPKSLLFTPSRPWQKATSYAAVLDKSLVSLAGYPLAEPKTFTFHTAPLQLEQVRQISFDREGRATLELLFDDNVIPGDVEQRLRLRDPKGADMAYTLQSAAPSRSVRVVTDSLDYEEITVHLEPGLAGQSGPLGLANTVERPLTILRDLKLDGMFPVMGEEGMQASVDCSFNSPIDAENAKAFVKIDPAVKFDVENRYDGMRIVGDFQPRKRYTVILRQGMKATNGFDLKEDVKRILYFPGMPSSVAIDTQGFYLSSQGSMLLPIQCVNVSQIRLEVSQVYPNNVVYFSEAIGYSSNWQWSDRNFSRTLIQEKTLDVKGAEDQTQEMGLELREILGQNAAGAYLVSARGLEGGEDHRLVLVTDMGICAKVSENDVLIWVNSILDLTPVAGAEVTVYSKTNQVLVKGKTDEQGIARLDAPEWKEDLRPFLVTAKKGEDFAYVDLDRTRISLTDFDVTGRPYLSKGYEAFLYTDRGVYRPGELVHVRGLLRGSGVSSPDPFPLEVEFLRPDRKRLALQKAMLGAHGTFECEVKLEESARTGLCRAMARLPGDKTSMGEVIFKVEEFVPPRIQCKIEMDESRIPAAQPVEFAAMGAHLFGAPAEGNLVQAKMRCLAASFQPEAWKGYEFGTDRSLSDTRYEIDLGEGNLDAEGRMSFTCNPPGWRACAPGMLTVEATVHENTGRTVTARKSRFVDFCPFYIGHREELDGGSYEPGKSYAMAVVAVAPDGNPAPCSEVKVLIQKATWTNAVRKDSDGRLRYDSQKQLRDIQTVPVTLSEGKGRFEFVPPEGGSYEFRVSAKGTDFICWWTVYVGRDWWWDQTSMKKPDLLQLVPDKAVYAPGDTVKLKVVSAIPGRGLLTVEGDRILSVKALDIPKIPAEIEVPIDPKYPNSLYISLMILRSAKGDEMLPFRTFGVAPIVVEHGARLDVSVEAPERVRPGDHLEIPLSVRTAQGKGVKAEVSMALVDEGICMLTSFETPDPLSFFYGKRLLGVSTADVYGLLMPEREKTARSDSSVAGGMDMSRLSLNPFLAKTFKPVALWVSGFETDSEGRASARVDIPEFTGELRIMAVAVAGKAMGSAQKPMKVKRDLVVNVGYPRFLAPGDRASIGVEIFNQGSQEARGQLAVEAGAPLKLEGESQKPLTLPAGGKVLETLTLSAVDASGIGSLKVSCTLGSDSFSTDTELSVRPPYPRLPIMGSERVTSQSEASITLPGGWVPGTVRKRILFSGLPQVQLAGAVRFLMRYPYGCVEQTTSAAFPLLYLKDLADVIEPGSLGEEEVTRKVTSAVNRLLSFQTYSGGFSSWPGGRDAYDWGSLYATQFLVEAQKAGQEVPSWNLEDALKYAELLLEESPSRHPLDESQLKRILATKAYAVYVLCQADRPPLSWLDRLLDEKDMMPSSGKCHLSLALVTQGRGDEALKILGEISISNAMLRETGGTLNSLARDQALLLSAWLDADPENPAVPSLVDKLNALKKNDDWGTTQENALSVMALGKYCRLVASQRKPFTAEVDKGGQNVLSFDQAKSQTLESSEPGEESLAVRVKGEGQAYVHWVCEGVPQEGKVEAKDAGLEVRRVIQNITPDASGVFFIKRGSLLDVTITLKGAVGLENVVIEDLLPAGLEVENARLDTSASGDSYSESEEEEGGGVGGPQPPFLEVRDDRVLLFTSLNAEGKSEFTYRVRAVTPGRFVMPPVTAQCMYDPGLCSVHGQGWVEVQE